MVALGQEQASRVLAHLSDEQVARLTWLVSGTETLTSHRRDEVLRDFYATLTSRDYASAGGPEAVQRMLEAAFGDEKATDIQANLGAIGRPKPFKFLERVQPDLLTTYLESEHPQLVALILAHLGTDVAAELITALPEGLQVEAIVRIVNLGTPALDALELTETIVQHRLSGAATVAGEALSLAGADQLVGVLRHLDVSTQRALLDGIADLDPELGALVRSQMFVFDDLILLDARSLQRVLRDVDQRDLTVALRAAPPDLVEFIFQNVSARASAMIREDMEAMGPVRLTAVHEAQNRIILVVARLEETDEIVINRGGADELVA
jgi:flagellar motor switch protein FliG